MKRILLISTGGTIASVEGAEGLAPGMQADAILSYVPELRDGYDVSTLPLFSIDSSNMRPEHWLRIARAIQDNYDDYDGFVVMHGTDTMAYTAAALSYLCLYLAKPVVLTGAQQPIERTATDGTRNLIDSFAVAADPGSRGVMIVFNGHVIAGTRARKTRSKSYNAFSSIDFPDLAVVRGGRVVRYIATGDAPSVPIFSHALEGRIFPLKLVPGMSPHVFDELIDDFDAIILESFGVGGIPMYPDESGDDAFARAIERWTQAGKIVVVTTQVPHEGSDMAIYQVGLHIRDRRGVIEAYDMTFESIYTKLMWILAQTRDPVRVERLFHTPINHDLVDLG
ncbi:MAG: asparaginase [Atopobiaceae bacterium]